MGAAAGRAAAVAHPVGGSLLAGAVSTAEELAIHLGTVADHPAAAMLTHRGHRLDRALEAVEDVPLPGRDYLECLVIFVSAHFTGGHLLLPSVVLLSGHTQ